MNPIAGRIAIILAGLMGAAGVALAAAGAHGATTGRLTTASTMLLFHAPAILAIVALASLHAVGRALASLAVAALLVGAVLFAADLALREWAGHGLFPMAAPTGGTLLIAGWIALALAGLFRPGQ